MKEKKSLKLLIGGLCVIVFGFGFASILKNVGISYALGSTGKDIDDYWCPLGNLNYAGENIDYPLKDSSNEFYCRLTASNASENVSGSVACQSYIDKYGSTYGITKGTYVESDSYSCHYDPIKKSCYLCASSSGSIYRWGAGFGSSCTIKSEYTTQTACEAQNSSGGETGGGDTPTPTTYAVTFNMQTGDVLKKNGTTQSSKTFNLSSINYADWTATRSGNTFNGWATSTSACANAVKSGSVTLTKALSLVPCFTKNSSGGGETGGGDTPTPTTYPVTFNMELMDELIKNGTKQSNRTFNLSSINYADWAAVREGATFLGWATSTSSCASAVKSGSVTLTKAISLVPCFEGGEYIVTFNMDDGDELWRDGLTQNTNTFKLDKIAFSDWEANRTGNTFLGWSEDSACTAPIKSGTITLKRNMSFYPCFNGSKKYNVSFDVSGGTLYYNGSKTSTTKYQLDKFDYSKFKATKDGYIFNGWSTNSGCTTNGKTTGTVNIKSDTKYYACFSVDNNSSGGGTIVDNPKTGSTLFYAIIIIGGIALAYAIYNHVVLKGKAEEN